MNKRKILSILVCVCIVICSMLVATVFIQNRENAPIVILYENDVHCAVDGYSKLSAMKKDLLNFSIQQIL